MENSDIQSTELKPKSNRGLTILLIIVIIALGATIAVLISKINQQQVAAQEVQTILEGEKQNLQKELTDLIGEYDNLKGNNDSLNKQIGEQQEKIKKLLRIQASNVELIGKYKKELSTLREVLKSYIAQVDSLNTRNQQLVSENVQVKTNLEQARTENTKISQEKDQLNSQVQKAAVITTSNIVVTPLDKRGKDASRISKTLKLKVCFTMRENAIAKPGNKDVFIRITNPAGSVITYSQSDVFNFQGQSIVYSARRQIEYENKDIDVCIFWDNNNQLTVGEYTIDIFTEGNLIGSTKFSMKK